MVNLEIQDNWSKPQIFEAVAQYLASQNIAVHQVDATRPWGGFFVIEESEAEKFIALFFPHLTKADLAISGKLSPKILIVAPQKRLSWQYHFRRAEIWKLIAGKASLTKSHTDEEANTMQLQIGDIVELAQGQRHRLLGDADCWGLVAEIWQHTDVDAPSDEDDIVRLQDDFGRK